MSRPNIIIINPDEMRWDTMGHMGNPAAQTPFLDSMAQSEAVSFRYAYCQNTVCVPSRCSFFTGLYPHVHGHRTMAHLLREGESSLFSELKAAGYYVWMNARNDLVAGQIPGLAQSHADEIYYYDKSKPTERIDPAQMKAIMSGHGAKTEDPFPYSHFKGLAERTAVDNDWNDTRAACERILHPAEPDKPLCLFLGWTNPHPPYMVEEPYFSAIDREKIPERIKYEETQGKSLMLTKLHELVGMDDYTEEQWRELRAVYLAQCSKVDAMFGAVCDALKEAGMYDNSAIFFLSDHGDFCGDYGLPEKSQNTFEDCLSRVPLLVKPPKGYPLDAGISDSLVELVDFYATAMDYADVEPDHDQFGRSLREAVGDRSKTVRDFVCCEGGRMAYEKQCDEWHIDGPEGPSKTSEYWPKKTAQSNDDAHEKGTMIFDGRYKYVRRLSGRDELYDMEHDPGERKNLLAELSANRQRGNEQSEQKENQFRDQKEKEVQEAAQRLQNSLLSWYQETCDIVPRAYDKRFTYERIWNSVRRLVPPEMKEEVREYISKEMPNIYAAVSDVMQLLADRK